MFSCLMNTKTFELKVALLTCRQVFLNKLLIVLLKYLTEFVLTLHRQSKLNFLKDEVRHGGHQIWKSNPVDPS